MTAVIIWILAAVGVALAALAVRAYLVEKREGLPRSSLRAAVSVGLAVGIIAMGVIAQLSAQAPAPTAPAPVERDAAAQAKLAALQQEVAELSTQLAAKQAELEALDPTAAPLAPPTETWWPLMVAISLVLVGFGALAFGDLTTLVPRRRQAAAAPAAPAQVPGQPQALDRPEPADVPTLAQHAQAGRWRKGLACAGRISIEQLHKLEQLDFLFLRALCGVMAVAAPEEGATVTHQDRAAKLAAAVGDLERLLGLAPHMAEARYLLGYAKARSGEWAPALEAVRAARPGLEEGGVAFDHNESVCLLALAEHDLATADSDGAARRFDEVTKIGVLAAQIPVAMVTHRILAVREQIKAGKLDAAADGIARIRQIEGLEGEAERAARVACDVYDVAIHHKAGELDKTLEATRAFFARWLPAQLPDVEDQVADEFLLPAIDKATLPLPADLYRGLFFVEAVTRLEQWSRTGRPLADGDVDTLATLLLRALQFQPRHRETLAALAALYLAYRKDRTEKALAWLDAALTMGVRSPRARALLAEARRAEVERKELLAMFRSASARFLSDPSVGAAVRQALIEELGRFDEFRPVVLDLQASGALDAAPVGEITVTALRERAAFVGGLASEVVARADQAAVARLAEIHRELTALANNVDTSATRIAALERAVMEQLGRIVLR